MLARFPVLNKWSVVVDHRGDWTLPDRLTDAFTVADRLVQTIAADTYDRAAERTALWTKVRDAGHDPQKKMPDLEAFAKAAAREKGHTEWALAVTAHLSDAVDGFEATILGWRDVIIREHLKPALQDVITRGTEVAPVAEGDGTRDSILEGSETSLKAWHTLDQLAKRYVRLRTAQDRLSEGACGLDFNPILFNEFRYGRRSVQHNYAALGEAPTPWPHTQVGRFLWLVRNFEEHPVWMPTPGERDHVWNETHAADAAQAEANRQRMATSR